MLTHIEQKVYRILYNYSRRGQMPTIRDLCAKTGRRPVEMLRILESLAKADMIEWERFHPEYYRLLSESEKWQRRWSSNNG